MTAPLCATPPNFPPTSLFRDYWFGKPGAMTKLSASGPDSGVSSPLSRGEVAHALSSGGTTVTRRPNVKRSYSLSMSALTPDTADNLISYYSGVRGLGPWTLLDPSWRNQMSTAASTFGAALGANTEWNASDQTVTIDATQTPPLVGGVPITSAVLKWIAPASSAVLFEGTITGLIPSLTRAVPYVPGMPYTLSVWLRVTSGTASIYFYALGCPATGYVNLASTPTVCAVTTTWQRFSVTVAANLWTASAAPYVCAYLNPVAAVAGSLLIAGASTSPGLTAVNPWVIGMGAPRVSISAPLGNSGSRYWRRDHTLTLSEN